MVPGFCAGHSLCCSFCNNPTIDSAKAAQNLIESSVESISTTGYKSATISSHISTFTPSYTLTSVSALALTKYTNANFDQFINVFINSAQGQNWAFDGP